MVTNSIENIEQEISSIINAFTIYPEIENVIGGIHLEGPFISRNAETRGAHNEKYIQAPDWELIQNWQKLAKGKIRIITFRKWFSLNITRQNNYFWEQLSNDKLWASIITDGFHLDINLIFFFIDKKRKTDFNK